MEPKDWLTLGTSCLALIVSASSAYYTYRSDQRAENLTKPIVSSSIQRRGLRDFLIRVTVRNRAPEQIRVQNLELFSPPAGVLWGLPAGTCELRTNDDRQTMLFVPSLPNPLNSNIQSILDPEATAVFCFQIALRDREAAPDQIKVRMTLTIGTGSEFKSPERFAVNSAE